jgi:hypothetical protein
VSSRSSNPHRKRDFRTWDTSHVTWDMSQVTSGMSQVTSDMSQVTSGMSQVTSDVSQVTWDVSKVLKSCLNCRGAAHTPPGWLAPPGAACDEESPK